MSVHVLKLSRLRFSLAGPAEPEPNSDLLRNIN